MNTDNRINYGPALENIVFTYARSKNYAVSTGRIGTLECDFILRSPKQKYACVQVAYTVAESRATEDREFRPLEKVNDNYPKYVMTTNYLLQNRGEIKYVNIMDFVTGNSDF